MARRRRNYGEAADYVLLQGKVPAEVRDKVHIMARTCGVSAGMLLEAMADHEEPGPDGKPVWWAEWAARHQVRTIPAQEPLAS